MNEAALPGFGELLSRYLIGGVRPEGLPDRPGHTWSNKAFAAALGATDEGRSVRGWRAGEHLPNDLAAIERVLFGDNKAWSAALQALREAYARSKALPPREETVSIEFSPRCEIDLTASKIGKKDISKFLQEELRNHPQIFASDFASLPFSFRRRVVVATLTGRKLLIERLIPEAGSERATLWSSALSLYRLGSNLGYRRDPRAAGEAAFAAAVRHHERLALALIAYGQAYGQHFGETIDVGYLSGLLEEAQHYLAAAEYGLLTPVIELLLSRAHKTLLNYVPDRHYVDGDVVDVDAQIKQLPHPDSIWSSKPGRTKIVLVIEDELLVALMVEDMLSDLDIDMKILVANSTAEAFTFLVNWRIDLIWADINMAGIMSFEVLRAFKRVSPSTKIAILSAYPDLAGFSDAFAVLAKPANASEFARVTGEALGG